MARKDLLSFNMDLPSYGVRSGKNTPLLKEADTIMGQALENICLRVLLEENLGVLLIDPDNTLSTRADENDFEMTLRGRNASFVLQATDPENKATAQDNQPKVAALLQNIDNTMGIAANRPFLYVNISPDALASKKLPQNLKNAIGQLETSLDISYDSHSKKIPATHVTDYSHITYSFDETLALSPSQDDKLPLPILLPDDGEDENFLIGLQKLTAAEISSNLNSTLGQRSFDLKAFKAFDADAQYENEPNILKAIGFEPKYPKR